ncbi:MAG TPA: hypothetical protein VFO77_03065 [Actinoplanes sp.]|nr:hypothetical protein [Actinoplanes sp.]
MNARTAARRRLVRLVVVLLIALVLAGGAGLVARYQPLLQSGDLQAGSDMQVVTIEEFEETGAHVLKYEDGEYVSYAFTVRNAGPVGITVTGVDLPAEAERRLLQPVAAGVATGDSADAAEMAPFEPFALAAGEEQRIIVQGRFDNCEYYTERAIEDVDGQTITFRVAGIPRTATVPFTRDLLVRSPTIKNCDERTLNRAEHRRTEP